VRTLLVRTLLLFVLAVMLSWNLTMPVGAQPHPAQSAAESAARKEVLEASEAVDRAMVDKNMSVMAALLSDQLEYTNQFGEVLTKAQWLDNIGTEKLRHVSFDHRVADLHIYGDAAVLTGVSHTVFEYKGAVSETPRRFTRFFVKQGGKWLLAGQHVTAIAER
jgi:ketosteroid isomerase-like protein